MQALSRGPNPEEIETRTAQLLGSPLSIYLLACTTLDRHDIERGPSTPVRPFGTPLAAALEDPTRLMWLAFQHVARWPYAHDREEAATRLLARSFLFEPAAQALAAAPGAQWWWEPLNRHAQTSYGQVSTDGPSAPDAVDLDTSATWPGQPAAAPRTSTQLSSLPGSYLAGWDDEPTALSIWQVPVRADARVVEIHSPADWADLVHRYPGDRPGPDWWLVADDWDGVHLSMAGYLTVPECAYWLHESTIWLRRAFGEIVRLPDWPYDDFYTNYGWPPPPWPRW